MSSNGAMPPFDVIGVGVNSIYQVYRLPDPHYALFKQVIIFGQRRAQPCTLPGLRDPEIARLRELTRDDAAVPVLPGEETAPDLPLSRQPGGLPTRPGDQVAARHGRQEGVGEARVVHAATPSSPSPGPVGSTIGARGSSTGVALLVAGRAGTVALASLRSRGEWNQGRSRIRTGGRWP